MQRNPPLSGKAVGVLRALAADPSRWRYGYALAMSRLRTRRPGMI
jgi:hypothetical protein